MSEKTKLIVWSSVLGFLILAIGGAGYYFLWMNRIQKTRKEITKLEDEVSDRRAKKNKIKGLRKQKQNLKASMDEFRKALPSLEENTPEQFIDELHAIAGNVGVNVTQYQTQQGGGPDTGDAGYETITLQIQVQGEVYRLFRYIWSLENQERLMRVNSFSLSPSEQDLTPGELQKIRGGLISTSVGGANQNSEKKKTIKRYIGTMDVITTVYIYSPPN